jgi:hypothetical protein
MDLDDEKAWNGLGNNGKPNSVLCFGTGSIVQNPRRKKTKKKHNNKKIFQN